MFLVRNRDTGAFVALFRFHGPFLHVGGDAGAFVALFTIVSGGSFGTFLDKLICRLNLERVLGRLSNQYFKERSTSYTYSEIDNGCFSQKELL